MIHCLWIISFAFLSHFLNVNMYTLYFLSVIGQSLSRHTPPSTIWVRSLSKCYATSKWSSQFGTIIETDLCMHHGKIQIFCLINNAFESGMRTQAFWVNQVERFASLSFSSFALFVNFLSFCVCFLSLSLAVHFSLKNGVTLRTLHVLE